MSTSTTARHADHDELFSRFEHALAAGNASEAVALVDGALDADADPVSLLCELITPAQRRIGERWQNAEWSVAQEHIATGISLAAAEAVARRVRALPLTRGRVIVGCAEREWHALAAMVAGTCLRTRGWHVTFLGAATPAERLYSYLYQVEPDVVAVSCSVAGGLPSTRRAIESATTAGIPVLAGGSAFGTDAHRGCSAPRRGRRRCRRDSTSARTSPRRSNPHHPCRRTSSRNSALSTPSTTAWCGASPPGGSPPGPSATATSSATPT
jgi:methanogenic corrinoid protein MtbC1